MKWPQYKLAQLTLAFISGGTPDTKTEDYWNGEIPWITGADFTDGEIILGRRYITREAVEHSATKVVPAGSVLMVTRTGVGKLAIAPVDLAISQDITGIMLVPGITAKFLIAALRNRMDTLLAVQRGATIKGVIRKDVENLLIPLPAASEQSRIVEILDQAYELRKRRAEADTKASGILPALFYKMFGDPVANLKAWPMSQFHEIADSRLGKMLDAKQQTGEHCRPYLRNANVQWDRLDLREVFEMDFDHDDREEFRLRKGDLLICEGGEVGRCAIWDEELPECYFQKALHRVRPKERESTSEYLLYLFMSLASRGGLLESTSQVTIAHLTGVKLKHMQIPAPPFELQKRFSALVENQKPAWLFRIKRRDHIDTLFNVLLDRAFAGDLTARWREAHMKELLAEVHLQSQYLDAMEAKT